MVGVRVGVGVVVILVTVLLETIFSYNWKKREDYSYFAVMK